MLTRVYFTNVQMICLVLLLAAAGCTFHVRPNPNTYTFSNENQNDLNKIPQRTYLVLTNAFTESNYSYWRGFDPYCWHVGPSLEVYAIRIAKKHFKDCLIVRDDAAKANDGDLLLVPTVRNLELSSFLWTWEKQHLTVDVEWRLHAKGNPNPLWMATASGNSEGTQGTPFNHWEGGRQMIQALITDLWNNTDEDFMVLHNIVK